MSGYRVMHWSLCCLAIAISVAGCTSDTKSTGINGSLELSLEVGNAEIDKVHYLITPTSTPMPTPMPTPTPAPNPGNGMSGWIDTSAPDSTASVEVFGLLPGDYIVTLSAIATDDV
ncbi:MAG: hypothetical protein JRF55_03340, partial [Deltaproteobacteria bacterium]|nr:hypothetical protein [Deltaproteobacteria bacterium]